MKLTCNQYSLAAKQKFFSISLDDVPDSAESHSPDGSQQRAEDYALIVYFDGSCTELEMNSEIDRIGFERFLLDQEPCRTQGNQTDDTG